MHIKLNDIKIIILFSPKCFLLFFWAFAVLLLCHWFFFCIYCYQLMYMYTFKYSIYCKEVNRKPVMKIVTQQGLYMLHKITQPHIYLLILPQHITILTLLSPHLNIYKTAFYLLHRVSYLSIAPLYVLVHQQCGHRVQEPAEK